MLKFENTANVGDVIKAFDFEPMPDRPDSYLIGRVIEKGPIYVPLEEGGTPRYICDGYTVFVKESQTGSFEHDVSRVGVHAYVPFEMGFSDYDGRVEVINEVS